MLNWRLLGRGTLALVPVAAALVLIAASNPMVVRLSDNCDPATFNAVFPPGTCVGNGQITLDHFFKELTAAQKVGAWHFDPSGGTVALGTVLSLENRGGELHTFTKVVAFGGGFIPELNAASGNPVPAPECLQAPNDDSNIFVEAGETEPGPTAGSTVMPIGTITKFQCCVHPWMRTELRAK